MRIAIGVGGEVLHFSRGVDALDVLALAQQVATTQAFSGGRLTLGVGVWHRPVIEGLHGLDYTSPAAHMRDYLSVLVPLLAKLASA